MDKSIEIGSTVRVIQVIAQTYPKQSISYQSAEKCYFGTYLGRIGRVVDIDESDIPNTVRFDFNGKIKIERFRNNELEVLI